MTEQRPLPEDRVVAILSVTLRAADRHAESLGLTVRAVEGDSGWAGGELTLTEVVLSGKFPRLSYGLLSVQA